MNASINIRNADESELNEVTKLIGTLFPASSPSIRSSDTVIVAKINARVVGFAHLSKINGKIVIRGIGTAPEFQNKGIGNALMEHVLAILKNENAIYLKVKEDNILALALYSKYGFMLKRYGKMHLLVKIRPN